jgi:hypothetical protein
MMREAWKAPLVAVLAAALVIGCARRRATAEDCREILDRIVTVELMEMGFRDRELAARKRREIRRSFGPELARCQGRPLSAAGLACVRTARTTEELSHVCLR